MKSILFTAALALCLSPLANVAHAEDAARTAQLQQRINTMARVIGETQVALDAAKVQGGTAFVKLSRNTFWGLVTATYAYQSSKGLLTGSAWGARVAQFGRDLGVNPNVMAHLTQGNNIVENVAQYGNRVSPSRMTWGVLGDTSDRIAQFAARGGIRIAGYSFLAASSLVAVTDAVYASGDAVVLALDAGAMTVLKARVELAHHELGEAVGDLAEASK